MCCLQLANVLNNEQLFYTCIFPFIAFFGAFAFVLYPMRDILHPTGECTTQACSTKLARPSVYIAVQLHWLHVFSKCLDGALV